jgi:hypothetical protein
MTEPDWLACATQPAAMLRHLVRRSRRRKLMLLGCGCCRLVWDHLGPADRAAVEAAERAADGADHAPVGPTPAISDPPDDGAGVTVAAAARNVVWAATHPDLNGGLDRAVNWALVAASAAVGPGGVRAALDRRRADLCDLFREVVGNPFRPWRVAPGFLGGGLVQPDGRAVRLPTGVRELAGAVHAGRAFDLLPVLADAAEDAGVTDAAMLAHLRHGAGHAAGCWAVDLLAGRG